MAHDDDAATGTGIARVGISGWRYAPWRGTFYPPGLRQRDELAYASERLATVEINGSFYSLQRPSSYRQWYADTPDGFVFAVKGGRYITHLLRLRNVHTALANFFASGVLALADKLGPVLWQLPERAVHDGALLDEFLAQLPATTTEAARLAADRDERMTDERTWLDVDVDRPCGTPWRSGTPATTPRPSPSNSAGTASRWWSPTPPGAGRICGT